MILNFQDNVHRKKIIKGIPSSSGLIISKAIVFRPELDFNFNEQITEEEVQENLDRLDIALNDIIAEFHKVLSKIDENNPEIIQVIESNLMILKDDYFIDSIKDQIRSKISVEKAIIDEFDKQINLLLKSKDLLLKERAYELEQIKDRLLLSLRNKCILYDAAKGLIVIAKSLSPSDVINFYDAGVKGFITEVGGVTSHAAILARNLGVPMIIGVLNVFDYVNDNNDIILDGYSGQIIVNPDELLLKEFKEKLKREEDRLKVFAEIKDLKSETKDGKYIKLMANIDIPKDVENAIKFGAEGIGLVRSEQLVISMNRIPNEEEQYKWYKSILDRAYPQTVTIRGFDIGTDKFSMGMHKHENNPALGFRGIRFLLAKPTIFKTQIRALLRATANKNLRFMLPMISCYEQVLKAKELIKEVMDELYSKGMPFDENMKVGVMIETPAAVMISEKLAEVSDFFSVGTNDLTQYTLAVDRSNEFVSNLYDSFHPSVLFMIKKSAEAAVRQNIPISVCGELAGHSAATKLLIGLDINELSVSPPNLLELKRRVLEISYSEAKQFAENILDIKNCENIREKLSIDN